MKQELKTLPKKKKKWGMLPKSTRKLEISHLKILNELDEIKVEQKFEMSTVYITSKYQETGHSLSKSSIHGPRLTTEFHFYTKLERTCNFP